MIVIQPWVAELHVSERTRQKIIQKHGITEEEVRDAVVCVTGLEGAWDDHAKYGLRAIVRTSINGKLAMIVLYPVESDFGGVWRLGSAYFVNGY